MTKREGAIISAHTGILCGSIAEMHTYVEQLLKEPVFTHELVLRANEIKEKSKEDFMNLIKNQTD